MNSPIGVLDSGVGGLSLWRELIKELPQESTLYVADSKNCPYGSREPQEIYALARRLVGFLIREDCKLIVLACNTITVSCLDKITRADFPHSTS
jgi:glutamate racemase